LTLNSDGSFTYTPAANFNGTDTFTYKANDGAADSAPATVTITVNAVNDIPTAVADSYTVNEDTTLTVPAATGVLNNDTDPDGNTLTAQLVTGPTHGQLTFNADGSFTYVPAANFSGSDTFTYRASDGTTTSSPVTVTINITAVNDAPVAANDNYSVTSGQTLTTTTTNGVIANDSDPDGTTPTAVLVQNVAHGTLTLNSNGTFTYTPTAGFVGTDTFTYRATDGSLQSSPATVTITVTSASTPQISGPTSGIRGQELSFVLSTTDGTSSNVSYAIDWDGNGTTDQTVTGPGNGTTVTHAFAASGNFNVKVTANGASTTQAVSITDSQRIGNTLFVGGTSGNDTIVVTSGRGNRIQVLVNGQRVGGLEKGVRKVVVHGGDGNDTITMNGRLNASAEFHGGAGNDVLTGGKLSDLLFGDDGDDVLNGAGGSDFLSGGDGDDRLIGASGHDVIFGGEGEDILNGGSHYNLLIGGTTEFDRDVKTAGAILHLWAGGGSFQNRMNRLNHLSRGGVKLLPGDTVQPDGEADKITVTAKDWIFTDLDNDTLIGRRRGRVVNLD
jgi:VCBS repeat-containing protein